LLCRLKGEKRPRSGRGARTPVGFSQSGRGPQIHHKLNVTIGKYMQDLKQCVKTPFQLTSGGFELVEDEIKRAYSETIEEK
jgi:hypothetical protein